MEIDAKGTIVLFEITDLPNGVYDDNDNRVDKKIEASVIPMYKKDIKLFGIDITVEEMALQFATSGMEGQEIKRLPKLTKAICNANQNANMMAIFASPENDIVFLGFGLKLPVSIFGDMSGLCLQPSLLYDGYKYTGGGKAVVFDEGAMLMIGDDGKFALIVGINYKVYTENV